jgi:hypothetical protein
MQQPWYATREQVKRALDSAETARNNAQIDRAIAAASRSIESQMHRRFYPWDGTKYFGFRPWADGNSSWRLWLNENDLVSATTLAVGATTISASDYLLEPVNDGPPYRSIEMDLSSNAVFASGETWQRSVAITGTFGYWDEQESVGTLADALDASESDTATITWTDPRNVGVGSILKVDSERLIVTEMSFVDSTQNTGAPLAASAADVTITISNSAGFYVGEVIRVDSERMLVVDTSSTTLTVKRAWDGSVLATHSTSADIYGRTGIEVSRAQLGSTLAAHTASDVVYRYVVPAGINDLCVAEALVQLQGEQSAYARAGGGSGESSFGTPGTGLAQLRKLTVAEYGRKARTMAI